MKQLFTRNHPRLGLKNFKNIYTYRVTNENGYKIKASYLFFLKNEIRIIFIFELIYIFEIREK
jgi:hypothetical protein